MARARSSSRRQFGATWWGQAWIDALEQRARLDPNRLPRGRTYARHDRVGAMTVAPGEVRAPVHGSRTSAYRVRVRVRPFESSEWGAALDAIVARAAHAAALLDGELSPGIVEDLESVGIDLLPVAGEVATSCSCPDWANPCKHAAAVCYLVADLLDDDPFNVLRLRGRDRDQVLAALRARRAAATGEASERRSADGDAADAGVVARSAFDPTAARPALPRPPLPPEHAARPVPLGIDPPADGGVEATELTALAADAAQRAWELAAGVGDGGLSLDAEADLARRAAAALGDRSYDGLVRHSGRAPREAARLAIAWRLGGAGAVAVLDDRWDPAPEVITEARSLLAPLGRLRVDANRISLPGGGQLRYGREGCWYRLARRGGRWEVVAPPDPDPVVVAGVRTGGG